MPSFGNLIRRITRVVAGVALGAGAFVAGYLLTTMLRYGAIKDLQTVPLPGGATRVVSNVGPTTHQIAGWLYFGAHNVPLRVSFVPAEGPTVDWTVSMQQGPLWEPYLLVVPPAVLLASGYLYGKLAAGTGPSNWLKGGVLLTAGYGVAAYVATYLSMYVLSVGVAAAILVPDVGRIWMVGVYSLVFGPLGALAHELRTGSRPGRR